MAAWKLWVVGGVAGIVGIIVGSALGTSGDDIVGRVTARLDQMDAKIDAMIADAKTAASGTAKIDTIEGATGALTQAVDELRQNLKNIETRITQSPDVSGAVQALGQRLDELGTSVKDATQRMVTAARNATSDVTGGASGAAGAAADASSAGDLTTAMGPDGKALGPGETLVLGDRRVFIRRVLPASGSTPATVEVSVVGGAASDVVAGTPLDLGGGCTVDLVGVADGNGYFKPTGC